MVILVFFGHFATTVPHSVISNSEKLTHPNIPVQLYMICSKQTRVHCVCSTDTCICFVQYRHVYLLCAVQIRVPGVCITNMCTWCVQYKYMFNCKWYVTNRYMYLVCAIQTSISDVHVQYRKVHLVCAVYCRYV